MLSTNETRHPASHRGDGGGGGGGGGRHDDIILLALPLRGLSSSEKDMTSFFLVSSLEKGATTAVTIHGSATTPPKQTKNKTPTTKNLTAFLLHFIHPITSTAVFSITMLVK